MKIKILGLALLLMLGAFAGLYSQSSVLTFDGVNDCVAIGDMGAELTTQYTAEAWIKPASLGGTGDIAQYGRTIFASSTLTEKPLWLVLKGSEIGIYAFIGQSNIPFYITAAAGISTDVWHHVAVSSTRSGTTTVYIDGVAKLSVPAGTIGLWNTNFTIGDLRPGRGLAFHGEIADVRVWNTIRTETEIQDNMYDGVPPDSPGLVGNWDLQGDALDSSSEPVYDGVIQNGTAVNPAPDWGGLNLWLDEPQTYLDYGETVTLDVWAENLLWYDPMRGFEMQVNYDTDYLTATAADFTEGTILSSFAVPQGTQFYVRGEDGAWIVSCAILSVPPGTWDEPFGASGDGILFSLGLTALQQPSCYTAIPVTLSDITLRDEINHPLYPDSVKGADIYVKPTLVIPLRTGWNLISSWVIPQDMTIEAVFLELKDAGYLVKVQDENGFAYEESVGDIWINDIGDYQMTEGYYVEVNTDCDLIIKGSCIILPMTVQLYAGWNIIPYPYTTDTGGLAFLQANMDTSKLIKIQDEEGFAIEPLVGGNWIDDIGNFEEGEGYYINVSEDTSITFPMP